MGPLPRGPRVAIVTNSGGPAVMATDALTEAGFDLAGLSPETLSRLRAALPPATRLGNPLDLVASGGAREFRLAVEAVLAEGGVDAALAIYTPPLDAPLVAVAEAIAEAAQDSGKPVLGVLLGEPPEASGPRALVAGGIPAYAFPERAVRALARLRDRERFLAAPAGDVPRYRFEDGVIDAIVRGALADERDHLHASEALALARAAGVPVAPFETAREPVEVAEAARRIGGPVAVKAEGRGIVHKTELGAVRLGLPTPERAAEASRGIRARLDAQGLRSEGFLVQAMAREGRETIVGVVTDPSFGPLVAFGLGGIYAEVLRQATFRLAPIDTAEAAEMARRPPAGRILEGVRGEPPADRRAIEDVLLRVGALALDRPEIAELDLNPLVVYPEGEGALAVDARVRLVPPRLAP